MDAEVHGFSASIASPINEIEHAKAAPATNGADSIEGDGSFMQKKHHKKHHHRKHPDIAERKMDGEVHGFSASIASPINEIEHDKAAPAMNGGEAPEEPASLTQKRSKLKDMNERGYDSEVYDFASGIVTAING